MGLFIISSLVSLLVGLFCFQLTHDGQATVVLIGISLVIVASILRTGRERNAWFFTVFLGLGIITGQIFQIVLKIIR